jgi:hypothetical protein
LTENLQKKLMTATQTQESILLMVQRITPSETTTTVIEALGTAWRRAAKGSETKKPLPLGEFSRERSNLTETERMFTKMYLEKRAGANAAPEQSPQPSVSATPDNATLIQKALDKEKSKWQKEAEAQRLADIEAALKEEQEKHRKETAQNREQYKLIHEAALQKALTTERQAIETEKKRLQNEAEAKLEREKQQLRQQLSGTSNQQIQSEKLTASLTAKAEIAEARAKLIAEFDAKTAERVEQERTRCETVFLKEKRQLAAKHQADTEGWTIEKETLIADKEKAVETAEAEKRFLLNDKKVAIEMLTQEHEANTAELQRERDLALIEAERLAWKKKLPSNYDVVNITSNLIAAYGLYNMLGLNGVILALMLISFFLGIVKDLKKVERKNAAWFGIMAAVIIEIVYGYIHNTLFQDLLQSKEHLGFDYHFVGTAFAVIISGASVYAALMTRLGTQDDAEAKRVNDIENSSNN